LWPAKTPSTIFDASSALPVRALAEHAVIDADNAYILAKHLRCAAAELPFSLGEARAVSTYAPALLQLLEEEGQLRRAGDAWYWAKAGTPSRDVSLRNIGDNTYSITDASETRLSARLTKRQAFNTVHTGAIYLHEAETYFVENSIRRSTWPFARRSEVDYFTQAMSEAAIRIDRNR
jgi:DEAD/DEAH box helicase domain-containing protein